MVNLLKRNSRNFLLLMPAFLMALLPWSLEKKLNVSIDDYDLSALLIPGFLILAFCGKFGREKISIDSIYIYAFYIFALLSLISLENQFIGHYLIGIEFVFGFIFAKNMEYNDELKFIIVYSSIFLLSVILFQQISISFGLGYIDSGQNKVELVDGIMRANTSVGASTITAIFVCVIVGIIVSNTKNRIIIIVVFIMGLLSILLSGTRSAMIMIVIMGVKLLFFGDIKFKFLYRAILFLIATVYIYPLFETVLEARNEVIYDVSDYSSGRFERWITALDILAKSTGSYMLGAGAGTVPVTAYSEQIKMLASPHNVYIGILFQYGIISLLVFLIFLWGKIKYAIKMCGMNIANVCLIVSLLVSWNTEIVPLMFVYAFYFWLLYYSNIKYKALN